MEIDQTARYTKTHEWVRIENSEALMGITDYAQDELSDVVYLELPEVGEHFDPGATWGVVESVKAASDLYMPVAGTIVAVNEELADNPGQVNEEPYKAWLVRFTPDNPEDVNGLLDADAYAEHVASEEGGH